jgi:hypothetical protein
MATSPYFSGNWPDKNRISNEYNLVESVMTESIQIMGHNCYFIPRESVDDPDLLFGEMINSIFKKAYLIEAIILNVEGFDGQGDFFTKFGLDIKDSSNYVISARTFRKIVPSTIRTRPQEGDLLYVPVFRQLVEIKFVEHEAAYNFHQGGSKNPFVYELRCEQFRAAEEPIDTGIDEIDEVADQNSYTLKLGLGTGNGKDYMHGEYVYQGANTAYAEVTSWDRPNKTITVINIKGEFALGVNVIGTTSNASYALSAYNPKEDNIYYDEYDNQVVQDAANTILDFTETNPFGTP